jgi:hypothetical protein
MRWGTVLAVLVALLLVVGSTTSSAQPVAHVACTQDVSATIGGEHKCLGAGEYCKKGAKYEREYEHYGFECRRKGGSYRLRRK